ncbi:plastocyanin/azurin family copper-binding protein [Haloferax sp. YSSS75]|uniref:cupredoxin domain-containing protein n=1 Tax=Haloferax sp. YSSS75 TaxID=3388564 RepID=UPI00398CB797
MLDTELHRRWFIIFAGTTAVTGLAGCTTTPPSTDGQGSGGESTSTDSAAVKGDDHHHDEAPHEDETLHDDADDHHHDEAPHEDETPHDEARHVHEELLEAPASHADVAMLTSSTGEHFEPHIAWVDVGGTVTWVNESGSHTATSYSSDNDRPQLVPEGAETWDSGLLTDRDETFEHTFETEGVYHYFCLPHEFVGMIGSVIVGTPDPDEQRALGDPPTALADPIRESIAGLNARIVDVLTHDE